MPAPSVEVHIPTHGRTAYLRTALMSALMQDYPGDVTVCVYNDCGAQQIEVPHSRVRVLNGDCPHPTIADKRQRMLQAAEAEWVAWLDDDDAWAPWRLKAVLEAARAGADLVFEDQWFVLLDDGGLLTQPCPGGIAFAASRRALQHDSVRGFDTTLDRGEDNDLRARLAAAGFVAHRNPDPGYVYRRAHGSLSRVGGEAFRRTALERIHAGAEPGGAVRVVPRLDDEYERILGSVLYARRARRGL